MKLLRHIVALLLLMGWIPGSPAASAQPSSPFIRVWNYLTTETLRYNGTVTDGQSVFVPLIRGQLLALDLVTGDRLWQTESEGQWLTELQFDEQNLYAAIGNPGQSTSLLLAFEKRTGKKLWQLAFDEPITSLTHPPGAARLYIGTATGSIMAIDSSSQQRLWELRTQGAIRSRARQYENVVYIGSDDHSLYALDATTGSQRWRFETRGAVRAPVEVAGPRLFVGSFDGSVYCLERTQGKRHWSMRTGAALEAQPVLADDRLIISSYDNYVYALAPKSGAVRWKTKLEGRLTGDPIILDTRVILSVLRTNSVAIVDIQQGQETNSFELGEAVELVAPPVMADDILILTTDQGIVAARWLRAGSEGVTSSLSSPVRVTTALSAGTSRAAR